MKEKNSLWHWAVSITHILGSHVNCTWLARAFHSHKGYGFCVIISERSHSCTVYKVAVLCNSLQKKNRSRVWCSLWNKEIDYRTPPILRHVHWQTDKTNRIHKTNNIINCEMNPFKSPYVRFIWLCVKVQMHGNKFRLSRNTIYYHLQRSKRS